MALTRRASSILFVSDVIVGVFLGAERWRVCQLNGSRYDMATTLRTWEVMSSVDWLGVTPEPVAQLLPISMGSGTVSVFTNEGATWLLQEGKESFLAQPLLHAVLCLRTPPS